MSLQIIKKTTAKTTMPGDKDFTFTPVSCGAGNHKPSDPLTLSLHKNNKRNGWPTLNIRMRPPVLQRFQKQEQQYVMVEQAWDEERSRLVLRIDRCEIGTVNSRKLEKAHRASPTSLIRFNGAAVGMSPHKAIAAEFEFDDSDRLVIWLPREWSEAIDAGFNPKPAREHLSRKPF